MLKKLMSLGLVGILSASLMVGCSSNSKDDDTVTIKYVDENGNVVKKDHVTRKEAKQIEQQQKQQTTKDNGATKKQTTKEHKQQAKDEDPTTNNYNYDEELYGNAVLGTCPDCGRHGMVFNGGNGLKCAYCGFYDPCYYADEEPEPDYSDNKEDDYTPEDNSNDYNDDEDYEEPETDNDVEESPSEPVEQEEEILP